ncbi:GTP:AMP phosphotransferase, mitochondrial [Cichlidogyrus casuarinus]|uniref:GTP:AMP phosphotransferase, mitochondrial n=1 Tax=Cichlidogyrus casuarinus TaxID=1844966 RepID=A0ABD2QD83_9PLAT
MKLAKKLSIILTGPPGCGKGTIAQRLCKDFPLIYISMGDILRREMNKNTDIGWKIKDAIHRGNLVQSNIVFSYVARELLNQPANDSRAFLLDGFPRTIQQFSMLQSISSINLVVDIKIPEDELLNRVADRWLHLPSGRTYNISFNPPKNPGVDDVTGEPLVRRADDTVETLLKRLEKYKSKHQQLELHCKFVLDPFSHIHRNLGILKSFHGRATDEIWPSIHKTVSLFVSPLNFTSYATA